MLLTSDFEALQLHVFTECAKATEFRDGTASASAYAYAISANSAAPAVSPRQVPSQSTQDLIRGLSLHSPRQSQGPNQSPNLPRSVSHPPAHPVRSYAARAHAEPQALSAVVVPIPISGNFDSGSAANERERESVRVCRCVYV